MKEMIYDRDKICVLDHGRCLDFDYYIVSYGTHPCAYVRIPENHPMYKVDYFDLTGDQDIDCHGGITYTENHLHRRKPCIEEDGWWIGWDYKHIGDYNATYGNQPIWDDYKRWTTQEIYQEVIHVCEQLRNQE